MLAFGALREQYTERGDGTASNRLRSSPTCRGTAPSHLICTGPPWSTDSLATLPTGQSALTVPSLAG
jgi:hypothetical protein